MQLVTGPGRPPQKSRCFEVVHWFSEIRQVEIMRFVLLQPATEAVSAFRLLLWILAKRSTVRNWIIPIFIIHCLANALIKASRKWTIINKHGLSRAVSCLFSQNENEKNLDLPVIWYLSLNHQWLFPSNSWNLISDFSHSLDSHCFN